MAEHTDSVIRKIKILHVVQDDKKFFEPALGHFNSDSRLENRCVMIVDRESDSFKSIPNTALVTPIWSKKQKIECFTNGDYDVIFFHSFCSGYWKLLDYVPKSKKVIWWSWGWDIYNDSDKRSSMLIPIKLLKPKTKQWTKDNLGLLHSIKSSIKLFTRPFYYLRKYKTLSRIDFLQPVIKEDFHLLKKYNPSFKAKEFYYPNSIGNNINNLQYKEPNGLILVGNSASYNNNHLDVWEKIRDYIRPTQNVIIPLSYCDQVYGDAIQTLTKQENVVALRDFMDRDSYFQMLDKCSYFVNGVLRQQSMGNISYCVWHGIKIFLYRNSVIYQYLKEIGVTVFAIEEINENSFSIPLPYDIAVQNCIAYKKEAERRTRIYEDFINSFKRS